MFTHSMISDDTDKVPQVRAPIKFRISLKSVGVFFSLLDCSLIMTSNFIGHVCYEYYLSGNLIGSDFGLVMGAAASLFYVLFAQASGLYSVGALRSPFGYLGRAAALSAFVCLALVAFLFLLKVGAVYSRGGMLASAGLQTFALVVARACASRLIKRMASTGVIVGQPVILIGDQNELEAISYQFLLDRFGFNEVGRIALCAHGDFCGSITKAMSLARNVKAQAFVLATQWADSDRLFAISRGFAASPLPVSLLPDHTVRAVLNKRSLWENNSLAIELQRAPMTRLEQKAKRFVDLCVSSAALVLMAPLLLLIAAAVKIDSPGPVFFCQRRSGIDRCHFQIFKFRTMRVMEDGTNVTQATRGDSRVTPLGRFLRRTSLDELPQLINVFKGDMSLIGPRPHAIAHDDIYQALIETYCSRHRVKPGMTGWAQVNGLRGETRNVEDMHARVDLDVWYTNNWSMRLDILIMLRTLFVVLKQDAY